jgi:hypothetical protein
MMGVDTAHMLLSANENVDDFFQNKKAEVLD